MKASNIEEMPVRLKIGFYNALSDLFVRLNHLEEARKLAAQSASHAKGSHLPMESIYAEERLENIEAIQSAQDTEQPQQPPTKKTRNQLPINSSPRPVSANSAPRPAPSPVPANSPIPFSGPLPSLFT